MSCVNSLTKIKQLWRSDQGLRALTYSLLFHVLLFSLLALLGDVRLVAPSKPASEPLIVEVLPETTRKRIVESQKGRIVEEAKKDAYLGEKNRIVEKETIAKESGDDRPKGKKRKKEASSQKKTLSLSQLGVPLLPPTTRPAEQAPPAPEFAQSGEGQGKYQDYIEGIKESTETALNTKEYVYFSYFQRIRQQLDQAWRPILKEHLIRVFKQGRRIASDMRLTTQTLVTLDKAGEVIKVEVVLASGRIALDQAAIKAFKSAGPFPNPPKGLIERSGRFQVRWDFILRT